MLDTVYKALSHPIRRRILLALDDDSPRPIAEVVSMESMPGDQDRTHVECRHVHLPRLADAGFIDRVHENDTIGKGPDFEEIQPHLEVLQERR